MDKILKGLIDKTFKLNIVTLIFACLLNASPDTFHVFTSLFTSYVCLWSFLFDLVTLTTYKLIKLSSFCHIFHSLWQWDDIKLYDPKMIIILVSYDMEKNIYLFQHSPPIPEQITHRYIRNPLTLTCKVLNYILDEMVKFTTTTCPL